MNTFGTFPRSTPTRAMEVALDIMPLHLFCRQEALAARTRLDNVLGIDWPGRAKTKTHAVSHLRHWQEKLDDFDININDSDRCRLVKWADGFRINKDSLSGEAKHRTHTQYNVYTDGSRINDQTGLGIAVYKGNREILTESARLPDYATVFQAEVAAIALAAKNLTSPKAPQNIKFVKIFVDSQAALLAIDNPTIKSKVVADAVEALNQLSQVASKVTLVWIPAHKGHKGNERADELAKSGADRTPITDKVHIGKPAAVVKKEIRDGVFRDWSKEWLQYDGAQHSKLFYFSPNPAKAKYVYKLARLELGRFIRIITGHSNLNYFQNKLGYSESENCRLCHEGQETFSHFVRECPRLWHTSRDFFRDKPPTNDMTWSVRDVLDFSFRPGINEAYEGQTLAVLGHRQSQELSDAASDSSTPSDPS